MAIKRIPIKGISRDPSGQISAEGMCAESFNVQLDMGEVAPMMKPKEIDFSYVDKTKFWAIYIHKGNNYEHVIFLNTDNELCDESGTLICTLPVSPISEVFQSITSVGNTLIISTDVSLHYILYKDEGYHYLGTQIPMPDIQVIPTRIDARVYTDDDNKLRLTREPHLSGEEDFEVEYDNSIPGTIVSGVKSTSYKIQDENTLRILGDIHAYIDYRKQLFLRNSQIIFPVFVRIVVRLYDDSLLTSNSPVLLGAEISQFATIHMKQTLNREGQILPQSYTYDIEADLPNRYGIGLLFGNQTYQLSDWEDIIKSVDVFISEQLDPFQNKDAALITMTSSTSDTNDFDIVLDPYYTQEHQRELLEQIQNTWLVKSYDLDFLSTISTNQLIELDDVDLTPDVLYNKDVFQGGLSPHTVVPKNLSNYNLRLVGNNVKTLLTAGYKYENSLAFQIKYPTDSYFKQRLVYDVNCNGHLYKVGRQISAPLLALKVKDVFDVNETKYPEIIPYKENDVNIEFGPWIAYPDTRCSNVALYLTCNIFENGAIVTYYKKKNYSMSVFGTQALAAHFAGLGHNLNTDCYENGEDFTDYPTLDFAVQEDNKVYLSKASNPFVFPETYVATMPGNVKQFATITHPLSSGQFGQFPLYVFTDEGVFAVTIDSTGVFAATSAVTRDILLNNDALASMEQGVFFASKRGVLLLQGMNITELSRFMDGESLSEDNELLDLISTHYINIYDSSNDIAFNSFINGCHMAFDAVTRRLIVFREDVCYQYVYMVDSQSWHKTSATLSSTPFLALNSYPDAWLSIRKNDGYSVENYSVERTEPNADVLPGLIYTRELSLDQQDIYKTIEWLKVRGRYTDGHIKWALQGSNDGINYRTLHSLRGPSWKWYRIAIVTMLDAQERISYIELDVNSKFMNKIR